MSNYLIDQLRSKSNIRTALRSEVKAVYGDTHLTAIDIVDRGSNEVRREESGGLFVLIGRDAETGWLPPEIARDPRGYILTGGDVVKAGRWKESRDPYLVETSVPGVFACGDALQPREARRLRRRRRQHRDRLCPSIFGKHRSCLAPRHERDPENCGDPGRRCRRL